MACRAVALAFIVHTGAFLAPRTLTQRCSLRASVNARDDSGETPLIKAAEAGDCDAVASLLQQGADATAESYTQWTPLHGAAENGCTQCVRLLLGAGARVDARAKSGLTPAEIAKKYGRDAAFELLGSRPLHVYASTSRGAAGPPAWTAEPPAHDPVLLPAVIRSSLQS